MLTVIAENWWLFVLRGAAALAFGMLALIWPGLTLELLVILFGVYVTAEAVLALAVAFRQGPGEPVWPPVLECAVGIAIGLFALVWPAGAAAVLLVFIGIWALLTGVLAITAAIRLRRHMMGEWALGLAGGVSVLVGLFFVFHPAAGAVAVVWLIGVYAALFEALLAVLGFRLRRYSRPVPPEAWHGAGCSSRGRAHGGRHASFKF